jgi:hypothetical protein
LNVNNKFEGINGLESFVYLCLDAVLEGILFLNSLWLWNGDLHICESVGW